MATKPRRTVIYLDGLLLIKSHKLLSRDLVKSCDNLKPLSQYHSTHGKPNLSSYWLAVKSFYLCYSILSSHDLARLRGKVKPLYLYYHNIYTSTILAQYLFPQNMKEWRLFLDCLLPIKSNDHIIAWFCEITWQTKKNYPHFHNAYGHKALKDHDLPWVTSTHKVTCTCNHVAL